MTDMEKGMIGIGVLVRDAEGFFKWSVSKSMVYIWDARMSEVNVVLEAIRR